MCEWLTSRTWIGADARSLRPGLPGGGARGILEHLQKSGHGKWASPLLALQADPTQDNEEGANSLAVSFFFGLQVYLLPAYPIEEHDQGAKSLQWFFSILQMGANSRCEAVSWVKESFHTCEWVLSLAWALWGSKRISKETYENVRMIYEKTAMERANLRSLGAWLQSFLLQSMLQCVAACCSEMLCIHLRYEKTTMERKLEISRGLITGQFSVATCVAVCCSVLLRPIYI